MQHTFAVVRNIEQLRAIVRWTNPPSFRQFQFFGHTSSSSSKLVDTAYPADTAIHLILDNHSAHISRETRAWLAEQPAGRFEFTFTPKHGSWLNLVEGFFSKLARSVLRHIRVSSKQELKERLMAAVDYFNRDPVVHTWTYKLDKAAR
jgi:transposase